MMRMKMENNRLCEICGNDISHKIKSALTCSSKCRSEKFQLINMEKIKEKAAKYYLDNIELKKKYKKEYYVKNSEVIKRKRKEYAKSNPDKIKISRINYYKNNKEVVSLRCNEYYKNNKSKRLEYSKKYIKNRREKDPVFKLSCNIRRLILLYMDNRGYTKKSRTYEILGCSYDEFKLYLESKFESWMNWDNYGKYNGRINFGWDIDHIIPISSAKTEEDMLKLNHYTNLQPLCSYINRVIKKDKLEWNK